MSSLSPPTLADLRAIGEWYGLDLSEAELRDFKTLIEERMGVYERIDELPRPAPERAYPTREPAPDPTAEADPHNALVTRCHVPGSSSGALAGYEVGVKDNIAVAGVEMTCASRVLAGHVPSEDAFVVEGLLDAGATVTAKTNMDEMAVSGSGEMGAGGAIRNPVDGDYLAGGSSGGSAVAVVDGLVDVALGTDQAGSLRTPASWSGCVGLKPTHGLVSYRGVVPLGHNLDHVGPMATSVDDCARVLSAIVGRDPHDPRQDPGRADSFDGPTETVPEDLTVGVVTDGFDLEHSEDAVDDCVRGAVEELEDAGATVRETPVEMHRDGLNIWLAVENEQTAMMMDADMSGYFVGGRYDAGFTEAFGRARRGAGDEFAPTVKLKMLYGRYMKEKFRGRYHAKAQNLRPALRAGYDEALDDVDVLAMPTTPMTAFEAESDLSRVELVNRAQGKRGRTRNTMPFNMTGHPALSLPCGLADGLPVGLMLVGPRFGDGDVLGAAAAVEDTVNWHDRRYHN